MTGLVLVIEAFGDCWLIVEAHNEGESVRVTVYVSECACASLCG